MMRPFAKKRQRRMILLFSISSKSAMPKLTRYTFITTKEKGERAIIFSQRFSWRSNIFHHGAPNYHHHVKGSSRNDVTFLLGEEGVS